MQDTIRTRSTRMLAVAAVVPAMLALAACGPSRIGDSRAQTLMGMPQPQYFAELQVARDLAAACPQYKYDTKLAQDMGDDRVKRGGVANAAVNQPGSIGLEVDIKKRSLAARYSVSSFGELNACDTLDQEIARMTPLSVMVVS